MSSDTEDTCGVCGRSLSSVGSDVLTSSSHGHPLESSREGPEFDNKILEVVRELSGKLAVPGYDLKKLVWVTGGSLGPDQPAFVRKRLGLRRELQGKLTLDEWRPLLAASLVYYAKFRGRRLFSGLVYLLGSVLGFAAFIWLFYSWILPVILPAGPVSGGTARAYSILVVWVFILFGVLFGALTTPYHRRLIILADRRASEELGIHEDLLRSLRKIESLSLPAESRMTRFIFRRLPLSERIRNLSEGGLSGPFQGNAENVALDPAELG